MQSQPQKETQYRPFWKRFITTAAIFVVPVLLVVSFSKTAHASLVSFMSSLLGSQQASADIVQVSHTTNSQNMIILAAATNLDPNPEKSADTVPVDGGETLVADLATSNSSSTDTSNTQISTYTVRDGDTISSVAKMFSVSVNTILWANDLSGKSVLRSGQTLVILPISGITYTVKSGDTLKGIAQKYHADVNDISNYNDLSVTVSLSAGQTIIIPDGEITTVQVASPGSRPHKITKAPNEPLLDGWQWPAMPGYFARPLANGTKTQGLHGHNAVDFGSPVGTPILASASGVVIIARMNGGWNGGYGNYVVISHPNGTQTLYAHMSRGAVTVGAQVSQGQTIGYVGMTGLTTGPHVHFEIRGAQNPF